MTKALKFNLNTRSKQTLITLMLRRAKTQMNYLRGFTKKNYNKIEMTDEKWVFVKISTGETGFSQPIVNKRQMMRHTRRMKENEWLNETRKNRPFKWFIWTINFILFKFIFKTFESLVNQNITFEPYDTCRIEMVGHYLKSIITKTYVISSFSSTSLMPLF